MGKEPILLQNKRFGAYLCRLVARLYKKRAYGIMTGMMAMDGILADRLRKLADTYENEKYFKEDPIVFPKFFYTESKRKGYRLEDIEIAGIISAHLAWGRRAMIVRDCNRAFDEMEWSPFEYVMERKWENRLDDGTSLHRTVKWSEFASICRNIERFYAAGNNSMESLGINGIRTEIYGKAEDPKAANKKINMMRRWFVRRNSPVDLGIWTGTDQAELLLPLDVHSHRQAMELGLTERKGKDLRTVREITEKLAEVFPGDPCRGDFALFGYGVANAGAAKLRQEDADRTNAGQDA